MCKKAEGVVQVPGPLPWLADCGGYSRPWPRELPSSRSWRMSPLTVGKPAFSAQTPDFPGATPDAMSERERMAQQGPPYIVPSYQCLCHWKQPNFSVVTGSPQTLMPSAPPCRSMAILPRKSCRTRKRYPLWQLYLQGLQILEGQMMAMLWLESPLFCHYFQYTPICACLLGHDLQSASHGQPNTWFTNTRWGIHISNVRFPRQPHITYPTPMVPGAFYQQKAPLSVEIPDKDCSFPESLHSGINWGKHRGCKTGTDQIAWSLKKF